MLSCLEQQIRVQVLLFTLLHHAQINYEEWLLTQTEGHLLSLPAFIVVC